MEKSVYNSGDIFGMLMLTGKAYVGNGSAKMVEAICDCGVIKWVRLSNLKNGSSKSCGCGVAKSASIQFTKHGLSQHKLYKVWEGVKRRCYSIKSKYYPNYGGRGVFMCNEWLNNPELFIYWAENNGYMEGLTLERIDNLKEYSPDNCRWATYKEQSRNKRSNNIITAFGETKCVTDWAIDDRCSITYQNINRRIKTMGWSSEKAISYKSLRT